jgi:hypothetical protein
LPSDPIARQLFARLHSDLGDEAWAPVLAFLERRERRTWAGWLTAMSKIVGPGSHFVGDDLAQACADDATLPKPIDGAGVLRDFVAKARRERMAANGAAPVGSGESVYNNAKTALADVGA